MLYIGIDLGTTNSVISLAKDGISHAIPIANWNTDRNIMPSVVDFSDKNNPKIFKFEHKNEDVLVKSIKRKMGENVKFFEKIPSEISSIILKELVNKAEDVIGEKINSAVITVPAYFDDTQRLSTKLAASLANIKVIRLINEPTAAAIAYGLQKKKNGIFGIYDFGGGTFDFSILRIQDDIFQVLATSGDTSLGGDDIDEEIAKLCCERYGASFEGLSFLDRKKCILAAKELKEERIPYIILSLSAFTAEFYVSADELGNIFKKYIDKTVNIARKSMENAKLLDTDLESIILIGGMTKSNKIKKFISESFICKILSDINPDETVSIGAALYAESILTESSNSLLIDVTPLGLGIETLGGGVDYLIYRNTPIPFERSVEYTTAENYQKNISFNVVQGESDRVDKCKSLARFNLSNIPSLPAGAVRIIVNFRIDVNGILSVSAFEKSTGISQEISIEPGNGLTIDEIMKVISEK